MKGQIARMENGGYLIEVTPPKDKLYPVRCPWESPESCKGCNLKCLNKEKKT